MKKKVLVSLLVIILIAILFLIPFAIEKIILCESIFPFNIAIHFSKETWFGFVASYLGAIGTILLGIIALYQNKKYKELSDISEKRFMTLQEEIKNLTEKSVSLIELNSRLEKAKYYPILSNMNHAYWNLTGEHLIQAFDFENDSFQISFKKENPNEILESYIDIFEKYYTFTYTLKNDSERTIRNFTCTSIIKNDQKNEMGFWLYQSCDIEPGAILRCVYATKFNLAQQCKDGIVHSLSFKYKMENVIGELFELTMDFYFIASTENEAPDFMVEISPIQKIEALAKSKRYNPYKHWAVAFSLSIRTRF